MARQALLVNPRRRRRAKRRAAPRRARRKTAARRRSPLTRRKRTRRRSNPVGYYVSNPRRRRRGGRRRRRSNPARRGVRGILNTFVVPALTAGAGAVVLDVVWGYIPVPGDIKTGPLRHVAKGAGAIALGWAVGQFAGRKTGDTMAMGALTVVAYNALRELTAQFAPQIPLGYYSAGMPMGYDPSLGIYVGPQRRIQQVQTPSGPQSEMGMYVPEGEGYWM